MHGSTSLYAVCCSHFGVVKALADARLQRARARAASLPGFIVRNSVFGLAPASGFGKTLSASVDTEFCYFIWKEHLPNGPVQVLAFRPLQIKRTSFPYVKTRNEFHDASL